MDGTSLTHHLIESEYASASASSIALEPQRLILVDWGFGLMVEGDAIIIALYHNGGFRLTLVPCCLQYRLVVWAIRKECPVIIQP